jgi:SagB-type dehydrogenase family enzyme
MLIKPNHSVMRIIASTLQFICFSGCILAQDMKPITLNPPDLKRGLPVMEAFSLRASATEFSDKKLTLQDLSDLLFAANGINRKDVSKRTAPSAMNAQDVDIYVFMQEGVYFYDPSNSVLTPVVAGDQRLIVAARQVTFAKAPVMLLLVSDISRFKMADEAAKLDAAGKDAGIVSQNINLFCAGTGLITRPRGTMDLEKIRSILKLKESQRPMLNNPVGYPVK